LKGRGFTQEWGVRRTGVYNELPDRPGISRQALDLRLETEAKIPDIAPRNRKKNGVSGTNHEDLEKISNPAWANGTRKPWQKVL